MKPTSKVLKCFNRLRIRGVAKTRNKCSIFTRDSSALTWHFLDLWFPSSGFVGKLAVDHLIQELRAKHLADIYSTSFPPQILIRTDGTADLIKNSIFYFEDTGPDPISLLLLTGDSQPANPDSEYLLAEEILDIALDLVLDRYLRSLYITGVL